MKEWVTSDYHFGHSKIFGKNCFETAREHFETLDEMNQTIIDKHNKVVSKDDITYNLGDISMSLKPEQVFEILNSMKGSFVIIKGNHDTTRILNYLKSHNYILPSGRNKFEIHNVGTQVKRNKTTLLMTHYPLLLDHNPRNTRNLCGHIHNNFAPESYQLNVGLDSPELNLTDFGNPLLLERAIELVNLKYISGEQNV